MIKKDIKFRNFEGEEQTETWYFNLNELEATKLEASFPGGMTKFIENMNEEEDGDRILNLLEMLILKSVGIRTKEGSRFVKSEEIVADFQSSPAFPALFVDLAVDGDRAAAFFTGVLGQASLIKLDPPEKKED